MASNRQLRRVLGERVVFHLTSSDSVEGVIKASCADGWVLLAPEMLRSDGQTVALSGELWVPREKVTFAQSVT